MRAFPLIRDLVTDVSWNYEVNKLIPPFTPEPDTEWRDAAGGRRPDRASSASASSASSARTSATSCATTTLKSRYFGPRFLVRIASLEMHPLDTADRTELLKDKAGIGLCNITKCCTEVCPEGIHITDNAIIPLKERVADRLLRPAVRARAPRQARRPVRPVG